MKDNISPVQLVYTDDNENKLGSIYTLNGTTYKFCKVAASSAAIRRYDYVSISSANVVTVGAGVAGAKQSGICAAIDVPVSTSDQYIYVVVDSANGYPVNYAATATASATLSDTPLIASASAAGSSAYTDGRLTSAGLTSLTSATVTASASVNAVFAEMLNIDKSRLRANGVVSAYSGDRSLTVCAIGSGANNYVTTTAAPAYDTFKCGDTIWYNTQARVVTSVASGTGETSAFLSSGYSATATGATVSVGSMRVPSIFD